MKVIGLMSGTSLDGLDICYVDFERNGDKWNYKIIRAEEESYPQELKNKLNTAQNMSALEYARLDSDYGLYLGERVKAFMQRNGIRPDEVIVASHGQTVFHQPHLKFTSQIGSGAGIAAITGADTVCDFRTTDVALGGQGAPLVPVGDRALFGEYDYCLNIGGFSNISSENEEHTKRVAHDISPVNYVLNLYMRRLGQDYDKDGLLARSGKVVRPLLDELNSLPFYTQEGPKSLGREWVESEIIPLMDNFRDENGALLSTADKLCTYCEHAAVQTARNVFAVTLPDGSKRKARVLVTGGGALNKYLMERFAANAPHCEYIIPDKQTVCFKEALIFAFLGVLFMEDIPNCMSSVTGAAYSCVGGALYKGGGVFYDGGKE